MDHWFWLVVPVAAHGGGPAGEAATTLADVLTDGDVILHKSQSSQSAALRAATGSPYTHVGMVFRRDGDAEVLEAVDPVRWTKLDDWVARGERGHVVILRLADDLPLRNGGSEALRAAAEAYLGRPYDPLFEWSDDRIYCSELVYKAYQSSLGVHIGALVTLDAFDLSSTQVGALIRARSPGLVNGSEPVVAPASLLTDSDLVIIYSNDPAYTPSGAPSDRH